LPYPVAVHRALQNLQRELLAFLLAIAEVAGTQFLKLSTRHARAAVPGVRGAVVFDAPRFDHRHDDPLIPNIKDYGKLFECVVGFKFLFHFVLTSSSRKFAICITLSI